MFEHRQFGWLLGRPKLSGGIVGWAGVAILPGLFVKVNAAAELDAIFHGEEFDHTFALGCTSSENLIAALKPDVARKIASKIIDLPLAIRLAAARGEPDKIPQRAIDLLAECVSKERESTIPQPLWVSLLEGRIDSDSDFNQADRLLRLLLYRLAQELRRSGEFRRYICYELPAHRVLLAQSTFPLLADVEGLAAIANELNSIQRVDRIELVTKHALDPADLIVSFEARRKFAIRHLGVLGSRLTLGEFRDLIGESTNADRVVMMVAKFLRNDINIKSMRTLVAQRAECQVVYDSIGTSTGRIVMKSPGVQWLEKKYRRHILPPEGYELRYLDYSCFEPTILAAVSGDAELLAACDSDIYERIGKWLGFQEPVSRDLAKSILLRFIYGQAQDKIIATLSAVAQIGPEDALSRLRGLERRLARTFEFRAELASRARATGYMETREGNRYPVGEEEAYKALSHYLQGTGALIFKRALIGIFNEGSVARLVVPLHDAFLCAFRSEGLGHCLRHAVAEMRSAFVEVTGTDLARVTVRDEF
ncbi:MAG TPA: DNA polymerase [Thermoanaerobaculia bacterium]|jgi:hypothetical protein